MEQLVDSHARVIDYLRLSVTDRCNLRCVYCMPPEGTTPLLHDDILTYEEMVRFAGCACAAGISKIRLTGGEPLVRKNVEVLIRRLADLSPDLDLSLTTNGVLLAEYAELFKECGLKRVNVSLDSLDARIYAQITRGGDLSRAIAGIESALRCGLEPVKLNVVAMRGVNDDLEPFVRFMREHAVDVRFIEFMETKTNVAKGVRYFIPAGEVERRLAAFGVLEQTEAPVGAGPARYKSLRGAAGKVGFISPVSSHFCPTCNRLRLTADGKLRACLFSNQETDIRSLLRSGASDEAVTEVIREVLQAKPKDHGPATGGLNRTMSQIGG